MPEQGWNHMETIESLVRKSGCTLPITEGLLKSIELQRFVSTKYTLPYERWAQLRR